MPWSWLEIHVICHQGQAGLETPADKFYPNGYKSNNPSMTCQVSFCHSPISNTDQSNRNVFTERPGLSAKTHHSNKEACMQLERGIGQASHLFERGKLKSKEMV